ncbi:hypothetical protein PAMP_015891 [Pampus punctatissimus]
MNPQGKKKSCIQKGSKLPCLNHDKHQQGSLRSAILDLPVSVSGRVIDTKGTSATQCGHCLPRGSPLGQTTWSEPLTAWLTAERWWKRRVGFTTSCTSWPTSLKSL